MINTFGSTSIALVGCGAALLLLNAAPPTLLAGGRVAEAMSYWWPGKQHPGRTNLNRTGDYAHRAGASMSPILQSLSWKPGLAFFAAGLSSVIVPDEGLSLTADQQGDHVGLPLAVGICGFLILIRILLSGPARAWFTRSGTAALAALKWSIRCAFVAVLLLSSHQIIAGIWLVALLLTSEALLSLIWHGYFLYHRHMLAWLPFATGALVMQVTAISILGPITWIIPRLFKDGPVARPIDSGVSRKMSVNKGDAQIGLRHAIDTVDGMRRPV